MNAQGRSRRLWTRWLPAIPMVLSMACSGCRSASLEMGDRVRRTAPGDTVPALESGAAYWILIDDVRMRSYIEAVRE